MDEINESSSHFNNRIEIPKPFHSENTGEPFRKCLVCGIDLIENKVEYLIEKAIRRYPSHDVEDVIFEHAICFKCQEDVSVNLSKESTQKINEYFRKNVDFRKRGMDMFSEEPDAEKWMKNCIVKDKPYKDFSEYQIYAHCEGDEMLFSVFPFMISGEAMEDIQELLSKATKDELDDFMDNYHSVPPEFDSLLKPRPVFI